MKLYKFLVEAYDKVSDDWDEAGTVLLPCNATYSQTEHALRAVGVCAPRGQDELYWGHTMRSDEYGEIYDASGALIVRMTQQ